MIGWPEIQFDPLPTAPNELVDVNIKHIVGTINTGFLISAVLALGFNFLRFRRKLYREEEALRKKSLLLGIGWMMWGIAEFLCTFNPVKITIVPNSIIFTALIMIFLGFAPLKDEKK
jgi:energy-converting hydrogenase Eha subunit G